LTTFVRCGNLYDKAKYARTTPETSVIRAGPTHSGLHVFKPASAGFLLFTFYVRLFTFCVRLVHFLGIQNPIMGNILSDDNYV